MSTDRRVAVTPRDASVLGVLQSIRAFTDAMDRMHSALKGDMDLNATDLVALRMLIVREQRDDPVSPHDLSRHLPISSASTTKLLDRLTAAGHIERRPHPHDRRARVIVLTDASRARRSRGISAHGCGRCAGSPRPTTTTSWP